MGVVKMTELWCKQIKPGSKQTDYYDAWEPLPGKSGKLLMRVGVKGTKTWVLMYRLNGKRCRYTMGHYPDMKLAQAHNQAVQTLSHILDGGDPAGERKVEKGAPTFSMLADVYLEFHARRHKKASSIREDERILQKDLLPAWGDMKGKDITRRHVIDLLDRVASRGPVMANRVLALASTIFNVGIDRELVEVNPCYRMKKPGGKEESRDRVLSEDEIKAVWVAYDKLRPLMKAIMQIRTLTAQRGEEVCSMRWEDIDFAERVWTIPAHVAKNKKAHRVPLVSAVVDILSPLREDTRSEWVFPSSHGSARGHIYNVQKAAQAVQRESEVEDFRLHDLRRTAASMMAEMGVSEFDIGKVLNHSSDSITQVYNRHAYDAEKRRALEKWADRLNRILTGNTAKILHLHAAA
ncbi:MAG: tyrosine-type recombinase/integrase [Candidatus Electrothrix sp. YB6]